MADSSWVLPTKPGPMGMFNQNANHSFQDSNFVDADNYVSISINVDLSDSPGSSPPDTAHSKTAWLSQLLREIRRPVGLVSSRNPFASASAHGKREEDDDGPSWNDFLEEIDGAKAPRSPVSVGKPLSRNIISVTSLECLDKTILPRGSISSLSSPCSEIYVEYMYSMGHGYPCFKPQPFRVPIQIGDVGFMGMDGFQAIFNLYDPPGDFLERCGVPEPTDIVLQTKVFREGNTLTPGVSMAKVSYSADQKSINHFQFRCDGPKGAVLAMTSAADLEAQKDNVALCDFLCEHATDLYRYSRKRHRLAPEEPLYVVTGCVRTDSWALAAHKKRMLQPYNLLVLQNRGILNDEDTVPTYSWTDTGNAEARDGQSKTSDQTLFLRGFLLTPSPSFLSKPIPVWGTDPNGSGNSGSHKHDHFGGGQEDRQSSDKSMGGGSSSSHQGAPSSSQFSNVLSLDNNFTVKSYPSHERINPLNCINQAVATGTSADFAIVHDDYWAKLVNDFGSMAPSSSGLSPSLSLELERTEDPQRASILNTQLNPRLVFPTPLDCTRFRDLFPALVAAKGPSAEAVSDEDAVPLISVIPDTAQGLLIVAGLAGSVKSSFIKTLVGAHNTSEDSGTATTMKMYTYTFPSGIQVVIADVPSLDCSDGSRDEVQALLVPFEQRQGTTFTGLIYVHDRTQPCEREKVEMDGVRHLWGIRSPKRVVVVSVSSQEDVRKYKFPRSFSELHSSGAQFLRWGKVPVDDTLQTHNGNRKMKTPQQVVQFFESFISAAPSTPPSISKVPSKRTASSTSTSSQATASKLKSPKVVRRELSAEDRDTIKAIVRKRTKIPPHVPISMSALMDPAEMGTRPPHAYGEMIQVAIWSAARQRLTFEGIVQAIEERYEYYAAQSSSVWKDVVYHLLCHDRCYVKTTEQRMEYWALDSVGLVEEDQRQQQILRAREEVPVAVM